MILPKFDKETYQLVLAELDPEERKMLTAVVDSMGGIDKFVEQFGKDVEIFVQEHAGEIDSMINDVRNMTNDEFESMVDDALNMSDEDFDYLIGAKPRVTAAQEEMAWQATDELLAKFFKKE